jgi:hypothetical protein
MSTCWIIFRRFNPVAKSSKLILFLTFFRSFWTNLTLTSADSKAWHIMQLLVSTKQFGLVCMIHLTEICHKFAIKYDNIT